MLAILSMIMVGVVAIEHVYILYLEMFAWTTPRGQRAFGTTPTLANDTKTLAANQGLYNGFLAAGLIWGLVYPNAAVATHIQIFFLCCVIVAAIYGGLTVMRSILFVQGGPALIALLLVLLQRL